MLHFWFTALLLTAQRVNDHVLNTSAVPCLRYVTLILLSRISVDSLSVRQVIVSYRCISLHGLYVFGKVSRTEGRAVCLFLQCLSLRYQGNGRWTMNMVWCQMQ